ncbi:hypothetical protein [Sphingomonas profundi]|uniref:hypothetical protein n=1 Tax=Alterirhizorhabdus profundi TaxID=2681549 RepID=UPI0012E6F6EE|nr:hypothetical protein [Sphingomonas profundi]
MADEQKVQAGGGDGKAGAPDGVNNAKAGSGGESAGGAYPNPHDPADTEGRSLGHGGQSDIGYTGPGQIDGKPVPGATGGQGG